MGETDLGSSGGSLCKSLQFLATHFHSLNPTKVPSSRTLAFALTEYFEQNLMFLKLVPLEHTTEA